MARNALAVIALIVLAAVLAITLAGQAHASTAPRCALPHGADVVAKHRSAVLYVTRGHHGNDYFACSRLNGRRSRLGFVGDEICDGWDTIAHFHFVGPFLAFVRSGSDCAGVSSYDQLRRLDLRTGAQATFRASDEESSLVLTLRLRSDGALAWLTDVGFDDNDDPTALQLWAAGPAGRGQLLDSSENDHAIPRGSLVLSPGSLAWTKDGAAATATV
jgi:hypothetical protein